MCMCVCVFIDRQRERQANRQMRENVETDSETLRKRQNEILRNGVKDMQSERVI